MEPGSSAERTGPGLEVRESASPVSVLGYSLHTTVLSAQPPAQPRPVMSTPGNVGEGEGGLSRSDCWCEGVSSAAVKDTICRAQTVLSAVTLSSGHTLLEVLEVVEVLEVPPPASSLTTLHPSYSALQTW